MATQSDICFICATKGRSRIFHQKAYPFLLSLGYPFLVGIEASEREAYGAVLNAVTYADGVGQSRALEILAGASGAKYVFKIDDDVSGFTSPASGSPLAAMLPVFEKAFATQPKLGAVAFPYQQEFYYDSRHSFSHMNARLQTCYLVRSGFLKSPRRQDPFEDFCTFLEIVDQGYFTLLCPVHKIKCLPVGETAGGLNATGDRAERGMAAIKKMQRDFPSFIITIKHRADKSWKYEPDYSKNRQLKKIKL